MTNDQAPMASGVWLGTIWSLRFGHLLEVMNPVQQHVRSPWPHRLAVVLACATFPLVWVGGLVTTTNSGMAVPDWPTTYGYNMFLYPWQSWLHGPWGVFYEHGHRLLGSLVGMLAIALLVAVLRTESRRWMKAMGFAVLGLVIFQGLLGGMRVRLDDRTFAMLHGFTGPLFFAVTVAMIVPHVGKRLAAVRCKFCGKHSSVVDCHCGARLPANCAGGGASPCAS